MTSAENKPIPSHRMHQKAVSYNNEACNQILLGNFDRAIKFLTTAVCLYKKTGCQAENSQGCTKQKDTMSVDLFMRPFPKRPSEKTDQRVDIAPMTRIYGKPISLPMNFANLCACSCCGGDEDLRSFSCDGSIPTLDCYYRCLPSIAFFNLALAYHLIGVKTQRTTFLRKAIDMYDCSWRSENRRCEDLLVSPFLLAAILSNMGHAARDAERTTMADSYFQKLYSMLTYLVQIRRISQIEFAVFFENSTAGLSRPVVKCASAA